MKPFRLLDLPPELWSRIVKDAATPQKEIRLNSRHFGQPFTTILRGALAVTRTCKTSRAETASTLRYNATSAHVGWGHGLDYADMLYWADCIARTFVKRKVVMMVESEFAARVVWQKQIEDRDFVYYGRELAGPEDLEIYKVRRKVDEGAGLLKRRLARKLAITHRTSRGPDASIASGTCFLLSRIDVLRIDRCTVRLWTFAYHSRLSARQS